MRSPFKFLNAYTVDDREHFFGREEEVNTLYNLVFKTNLMLVYGLSGTGKTSLVQCGLANRFDDSEWYPFLIRREDNINDSIFKATKVALGDEQTDDIVENIRTINENYYRPVYLILDQFEELFILGDKDEQLACMANIKSVLDANLPCTIILIMREEYIGRLYPYEQTIPALFDHRFRVEAMGPMQVKEVISKSFETFNVQVEAPEDASIQLILDNISNENNEIALPYLQVYLDILYREEFKRTFGDKEVTERYPLLPLTREDISMAGKIDDVLNKFLDEQEVNIYNAMRSKYPEFEREFISDILDIFVTEEGTKRPLSITREGNDLVFSDATALHFSNINPAVLQDVLQALEQSRLLHIDNDSIELAHDSLAVLVEERRSEEQKLHNQLRKRLANSFEEYSNSGTFLTKRQLESYAEFLPSLSLSPEISAFIENSREEATRRAQQEIENQRKQLEAEQEIKKAELIRQKLKAEKKARRRLGVGVTIVSILLPIIAYMWYTTREKNVEIQEQKITVDSLLDESRKDNLALSKINSELNYVKSILDTINQAGISGDSLYLLVSQAVSSIDAIQDDKVIEDAIPDGSRVVRAFTTGRRSGTTKKQVFKKGDIVYLYSYLNVPPSGDRISMVWKNPDDVEYHRKSVAMGYNWENDGAEFWDAKGRLTKNGAYKVEILAGDNEVIHVVNFEVR